MVALFLSLTLVGACGSSAPAVSTTQPPGKLVGKFEEKSPKDDVAAFGSIWITNDNFNEVTRIDPSTGQSIATVSLDAAATALAVSPDAVWVTSYPGVMVSRLDPTTNRVVGKVSPGGQGPLGIIYFDGFVWVANHDATPTGSVAKIDPTAMKVVDTIFVGTDNTNGPIWLAGGAGSLWVGVPNLSAIVRIDPTTDKVIATINDTGVSSEIRADDHGVWAPAGDIPGITHIDPATNNVTRVGDEDRIGDALALGQGAVWFGTHNSLDRIDPTSRKFTGRLDLPGPAYSAIAAFGYVWVTDFEDQLLFKVKPTG